MRGVTHAKVKATIILAVVDHSQLNKERARIWSERSISVACQNAIVQSGETTGVITTGGIWPVAVLALRHSLASHAREFEDEAPSSSSSTASAKNGSGYHGA